MRQTARSIARGPATGADVDFIYALREAAYRERVEALFGPWIEAQQRELLATDMDGGDPDRDDPDRGWVRGWSGPDDPDRDDPGMIRTGVGFVSFDCSVVRRTDNQSGRFGQISD